MYHIDWSESSYSHSTVHRKTVEPSIPVVKKTARTRVSGVAPGVTTPYIEIAVPRCRRVKLKC
jgi:hypothetical protein